MRVNFTDEEYALIRQLSDYYRTWPASLVHFAMMKWAEADARRILKAQEKGSGSGEGSGPSGRLDPEGPAIGGTATGGTTTRRGAKVR